MLVMYGIIIFFFLLLGNGLLETIMAWHSSFCFIASSLFWVESKKVQPLIFLLLFLPLKFASALKLLWVTQNFRLPFKCTEAFPLKKPARMDFGNLMWQKKNLKNKTKHRRNFGKMFKNKIHIPLGGDIETMLLPKNSLKLISSDLPHFFFFLLHLVIVKCGMLWVPSI